MTRNVLVVDDKEMMRDSVGGTLQRAGFTVTTAPDAAAALELIPRRRPDAVVSDLKMPGMTGIELLEKIRQIDDQLPVLLMTAFGTIETAVRAMKLGAFDYLTKPFEGDELIIAVKRAIEHGRLLRENAILRSSAPAGAPRDGEARPAGLDRLVGSSGAMAILREQLGAVDPRHADVGDHHVERLPRQLVEGVPAAEREHHAPAPPLLAEQIPQAVQDRRLVVDEEDAGLDGGLGHATASRPAAAACGAPCSGSRM